MIIKVKTWICVVCILCTLFILIFSLDFYFLSFLSAHEKKILKIKEFNKYSYFNHDHVNLHSNISLLFNISRKVDQINPSFINQNPRHFNIRKKLVKSFKPVAYERIEHVWQVANSVKICFLLHENKFVIQNLFYSGPSITKFILKMLMIQWDKCYLRCKMLK